MIDRPADHEPAQPSAQAGQAKALAARPSRLPIAILGAGLSGMSAAFHLGRAGVPWRIFERDAEPGGYVVTLQERGYRFDRTGHLLHVTDAETRRLALGWMGPEHREIERRAAIWSHGVYTRYPFQANLYGLPPKVAFDCLMGFINARAQAQTRRPDAALPRTFEQYCIETFGQPISEHFMLPYNRRLWGVSPSEITADWCSRFIPVPTLEDVVAGAVGLCDRELGYNARFLYPKEGIGKLSSGLAQAIGPVELGRPAERVRVDARELVVSSRAAASESVPYELLISTMPLPSLVAIIEDAPEAVKQAAQRLRATHLWYLDVALRRQAGQPYHWIYVPEERYPFYRVGCYSHFSPEMAPPGMACLYVELVSRHKPVLGEVLPGVVDALVSMGVLECPEDVLFARLRLLDPAYVIFDEHALPALELIHAWLRTKRVLSIGRYGGWGYSSMADALRFGQDAAAEARALLGG